MWITHGKCFFSAPSIHDRSPRKRTHMNISPILRRQNPQNRNQLLACVTILSLTSNAPVGASGFGFEYQSAMASARGNALTSGFGGSEMLHYNPAALVLGDRPEASLNFFFPKGEISVTQGGNRYRTDEDWLFAGSFFYAHPFEIEERKHALGFGVRSPYGQSASWQQGVPFAAFGREAEMEHLEFLLGGAVDLGQGFSLGGNLVLARSDLESTANGTMLPTDTQIFSGDDAAVGYQLAFHHQVNSRLSWGLNYRSGYDLTYKGSLDYQSGNSFVPGASLPASFALNIPEHFTIGGSYRVTDSWLVALQSQWTRWSDVESFDLSTPIQNVTQPVNWQNGWIHSVGTTWSVRPEIDLHAGYMFADSIIEEPFNTPLNGDFKKHFFSVGASIHLESWRLDLAVVRMLSEGREVANSIYAFSGNHESESWFLNLGLGKNF